MVKVGISLGLDSRKLSDVGEDKIHETMIDRWLGKQDYIMKISGTPTWGKLVKALRSNGYNGVAMSIEAKEKGMIILVSMCRNQGGSGGCSPPIQFW